MMAGIRIKTEHREYSVTGLDEVIAYRDLVKVVMVIEHIEGSEAPMSKATTTELDNDRGGRIGLSINSKAGEKRDGTHTYGRKNEKDIRSITIRR